MMQRKNEFEQLGQEFAVQLFENIDFELDLNYVDDATAPE